MSKLLFKSFLLALGIYNLLIAFAQFVFTDLFIPSIGLSHLMGPPFFPRVSAIFEFIVGIGFFISFSDPRRYRAFTWLIALSKTLVGCLFIGQYLIRTGPSPLLTIGFIEIFMGIAVFILDLVSAASEHRNHT